MGGKFITNDTLRISKEQGFPAFLDLETHLAKPFTLADVEGQTFSFTKPDLRLYQPTPIRVSWVEDINGKWVYWGMIRVLSTTLDFEKNTTSGLYQVVKLFTPEQMRSYFDMKDGVEDNNYF